MTQNAHNGQRRDLSRREVEVLEMAALGLTNQEIARKLEVTIHAVKFHLASIYRKLGVANRTQAVVHFLPHSADGHAVEAGGS